MGRFAERFRLVVGMWIFVGFGGSLMVAAFGIMAVTGSGVFQDKGEFSVDSEFTPGEEVPTNTVRPGGFMVLAYPATADLSTVECIKRSRVYSTGKQEIDQVVVERPDGVAPTLRTLERTPRTFVPVAAVDWLGTDYISCTGAGVESFALTSTKGVTTDGYRYGVGAFLLVLCPVMFGLGFLALHLTRTWSSRAAARAYPQAYGQAPQAYGQPPQAYPQQAPPVNPPLPPGHNPYGPPPGPPR
ncbi:hypothetical protein [Actinotalea subterranea]|uniref:hypothetical protein n=1 Tax=Actinotalea subterranea TaxID=2607497 RepID=UPI0011ECEC6B|nr:hypothetical protein [Actinotalea subterranea]